MEDGLQMEHKNLLENCEFYHVGIVVEDFQAALDELAISHGLEWASIQHRKFDVRQPNGIVEADFRVTYSIQGPPHFEIIESSPGTIWSYAGGGIHHLGYWSNNLEADAEVLNSVGFKWEATYSNPETDSPFGFTYHTLGVTKTRIELVDRARKTAFDTWIAGGDFPSALDDQGMKD